MAHCDEARQMLSAAYKDFRALAGMSDTEVFADEVFGFHAQQSVEKALKAWLALLSVEYPRTHDISLLLNMLRDRGQSVESLYELLEFSSYAVQYRYEAFDEIGVPLDRRSAIDRVAGLLETVEARVGSTT